MPPTPKSIRPILFTERFLVKKIQTAPINKIGRAYSPSLNPIIKEVTVVPILAPMTIPIACRNVNRPALTIPTVITVTPELDWISAVITIPTKIPKMGLLVYLSIK